jgi:hypothetical protein
MGLYHPLDGVTNLKYKLYFLTPIINNFKDKGTSFNQDRYCHLAICLRLILFHWNHSYLSVIFADEAVNYGSVNETLNKRLGEEDKMLPGLLT